MNTNTRNRWQMQDAKARLSHVVKQARSKGPQFITVHGEEVGVLLSIEDYRKGTGNPRPSLIEALLAMPKVPGFRIRRGKQEMIGKSRLFTQDK